MKKETNKILADLIAQGENYNIEFKESIDKSFAEEVAAFANASGGRVLLGVSDDVNITNPGGIPKALNPNDFGKISIRRNSVIASLLQRCDYIEKMGTGIQRMRNAMIEAKLPEPEFNFDSFFITTFKRESYLVKINKELEQKSTQKENIDKQLNTNENEGKSSLKSSLKILELLIENPNYTQEEISEKLEITRRAVIKQMSKLKAEGKIERIGSDREGYWIVKDNNKE